ncbi:MAG: peptidoglycan DD-metalloendopeptidase family protein [Bacteroidales bacterium]|nr:peptidoglycan DD-metalloendopeptidase family protein [Bacteroidales bacterium]
MNFRKCILTAAAIALPVFAVAGPDIKPSIQNKKQAAVVVPRPALEPVKSLIEANAIDTLSTSDPLIKIILLEDFTWHYWKNPEDRMSDRIFTSNWNNEYPNPYHMPLDSLSEEVIIPIVDSVNTFFSPFKGKVYSKFGRRHGRNHMGVDLPLHFGDPVCAAFDGKVRMAKYYHGYGNLVILRHENGLETFYSHMSKILVSEGDWVHAGQQLGLCGSTGRATGPHLHFETRYKGYAFDPEWIVDFPQAMLRHGVFVLKKKYLDAHSSYVPESDDEEFEINEGDAKEKAIAEEKAAKAKAEAEQKAKELAAAQYHTVRSGDTLSGIAQRYHTTVRKICSLNGITERTILRVGKRLRVK